MSQFIETICYVNRELRNLDLHQNRFNKTRLAHFPKAKLINLTEEITIPSNLNEDKYKVRVVYGKDIELIEFIPYQIKPLNTIAVYKIDSLFDYTYKNIDRSYFDQIIRQSGKDDLILIKDNFVTDTTYTNLIFFNGTEWHTPSTYLLPGIMRQHLLNKEKVKEKVIKITDLKNYISFKRINAMISFEEAEIFDIKTIESFVF